MTTRPAIFKWRQTEPQLILCAVRWYLRYSLSLRDVEELLEERCLESRPHDSMALGAAVWSGTGPPSAPPSETNQQVVACGRDLCKSERPLVLSVSSDRFNGCHH